MNYLDTEIRIVTDEGTRDTTMRAQVCTDDGFADAAPEIMSTLLHGETYRDGGAGAAFTVALLHYPTPTDAPNRPTWEGYEHEPYRRGNNRVYAAPPLLHGTLIDVMNPRGMHNGFSTCGPIHGPRTWARMGTGEWEHGAIDRADILDCLALTGDLEAAMALHG